MSDPSRCRTLCLDRASRPRMKDILKRYEANSGEKAGDPSFAKMAVKQRKCAARALAPEFPRSCGETRRRQHVRRSPVQGVMPLLRRNFALTPARSIARFLRETG